MSKFPDILTFLFVFFLLLSSCSTPEKLDPNITIATSDSATDADDSDVAGHSHDDVLVDKAQNSIKIKVPEKSDEIPNEKSGPEKIGGSTAKKKIKKKPLFDWPVWEARMTRGYLPRGTKKRRRPHRGIDLAAPRGSAVLSSHEGVVIYTGSGFKGYGKMIMLESVDSRNNGSNNGSNNSSNNSSWATLYGHLDKILVYEGKRVKQGEVIGALGNTGRSSGPHLHFEIRRLNGPIDPLPLLPAGENLTNDVDNGAIEE